MRVVVVGLFVLGLVRVGLATDTMKFFGDVDDSLAPISSSDEMQNANKSPKLVQELVMVKKPFVPATTPTTVIASNLQPKEQNDPEQQQQQQQQQQEQQQQQQQQQTQEHSSPLATKPTSFATQSNDEITNTKTAPPTHALTPQNIDSVASDLGLPSSENPQLMVNATEVDTVEKRAQLHSDMNVPTQPHDDNAMPSTCCHKKGPFPSVTNDTDPSFSSSISVPPSVSISPLPSPLPNEVFANVVSCGSLLAKATNEINVGVVVRCNSSVLGGGVVGACWEATEHALRGLHQLGQGVVENICVQTISLRPLASTTTSLCQHSVTLLRTAVSKSWPGREHWLQTHGSVAIKNAVETLHRVSVGEGAPLAKDVLLQCTLELAQTAAEFFLDIGAVSADSSNAVQMLASVSAVAIDARRRVFVENGFPNTGLFGAQQNTETSGRLAWLAHKTLQTAIDARISVAVRHFEIPNVMNSIVPIVSRGGGLTVAAFLVPGQTDRVPTSEHRISLHSTDFAICSSECNGQVTLKATTPTSPSNAPLTNVVVVTVISTAITHMARVIHWFSCSRACAMANALGATVTAYLVDPNTSKLVPAPPQLANGWVEVTLAQNEARVCGAFHQELSFPWVVVGPVANGECSFTGDVGGDEHGYCVSMIPSVCLEHQHTQANTFLNLPSIEAEVIHKEQTKNAAKLNSKDDRALLPEHVAEEALVESVAVQQPMSQELLGVSAGAARSPVTDTWPLLAAMCATLATLLVVVIMFGVAVSFKTDQNQRSFV